MKSAVVIAALGVSLAVAFGQPTPDLLDQYRQDLKAHRNSSLAHFRIAEILSEQGNYQGAANEFREALSGDLQPRWTEAWAHIGLARIYDMTSQQARATNEYRLAVKTGDDTQGALTEATDKLTASGAAAREAPSSLLARTDPEYSEEALLAELEGTVIVTGSTDGDGRAADLRVTQSLGLGLDEKAMQAVRQWRFKPNTKSMNVAVDFSLSSKQSRWHLIGVDFHPPEETSRPTVLSAFYPSGAGVFNSAAIEEGRLLGAIGRQSFVTLSFDVNEQGVPVDIQVERASHDVWSDQAVTVLRGWRFAPGMKDGRPASVPCTFDFAWGPRILGLREVTQIRSALHPSPSPSPTPSGEAWRPQVIYRPDPPYPPQARSAGLEGTVRVAFFVGQEGAPQDIQVTQGLGSLVDPEVTDAIGQWRFVPPPLLNGQAALVGVKIEVSFQLPDQVHSKILETTPGIATPGRAKR